MPDSKTTIPLIETADGSWTCFSNQIGEHYHNRYGAYQEACEVYLEHTQLEKRLAANSHLTVLDPFFGLGYNSFSCMAEFQKLRQSQFPDATLNVIAWENDPDILATIPLALEKDDPYNLKRFLPAFEHNTYYQTLRDVSDLILNLKLDPETGMGVQQIIGDTRQLVRQMPDDSIDVIYHDAFSVRKQPELWTQQLFEQYHRILNPETGVLITYSASAAVRGSIKEAGFWVYPTIAAQFKAGTLGFLHEQPDWPQLPKLEAALIDSRSGIPYFDSATLDWSRETILEERKKIYDVSDRPTSSFTHRTYGV